MIGFDLDDVQVRLLAALVIRKAGVVERVVSGPLSLMMDAGLYEV